jgi:hypothetical protein
MFFRLQQFVADLTLDSTGVEPLTFDLRRVHEIKVVLTMEGEGAGARLRCTAETEFEPSEQIRRAFQSLADERLPAGHLPREKWTRDHDYIDPEGHIHDNHILPMYLMPDGFQSFASALSAELREAANTVIGLLRWRSRTFGPRHPFSTRGVEWALVSGEWRHLPSTVHLAFSDVSDLQVTDAAAADLQSLLRQDQREPLAHELLREAWSERLDNPRSSLLIGIAALEIGIKNYISLCIPDAEWLAQEAPTPPVTRLMGEYLPTLNPPGGGPRLDPFGSELMRLLKNAVFERNRLTHAGIEVETKRVEAILLAVRDVLWNLDAAVGHAWAAAYHRASLDERPSVGWRRI